MVQVWYRKQGSCRGARIIGRIPRSAALFRPSQRSVCADVERGWCLEATILVSSGHAKSARVRHVRCRGREDQHILTVNILRNRIRNVGKILLSAEPGVPAGVIGKPHNVRPASIVCGFARLLYLIVVSAQICCLAWMYASG